MISMLLARVRVTFQFSDDLLVKDKQEIYLIPSSCELSTLRALLNQFFDIPITLPLTISIGEHLFRTSLRAHLEDLKISPESVVSIFISSNKTKEKRLHCKTIVSDVAGHPVTSSILCIDYSGFLTIEDGESCFQLTPSVVSRFPRRLLWLHDSFFVVGGTNLELWAHGSSDFVLVADSTTSAGMVAALAGGRGSVLLYSLSQYGVLDAVRQGEKNLESVAQIQVNSNRSTDLSLVPTDNHILSSSLTGRLSLHDMTTMQMISDFNAKTPLTRFFYSEVVNAVICGTTSGLLVMKDPRTKYSNSIHAHENVVTDISYESSNGQSFATAGRDNIVKVWDVRATRTCTKSYNLGKDRTPFALDWVGANLAVGGNFGSILLEEFDVLKQ